MAKCIFNGPVGQVIEGGDFKTVSAKITMGPNGEMIVESEVVLADEQEDLSL